VPADMTRIFGTAREFNDHISNSIKGKIFACVGGKFEFWGYLRMDISIEKERMIKTDREFSRMSVKEGAPVAFDAYMAENAIMLRNGTGPLTGRDAINKNFENFPKNATLKWKPIMAEISQSGDFGFTIGDWELSTVDPNGHEKKGFGNYISIWKKQPDGSWKFIFDSGTEKNAT